MNIPRFGLGTWQTTQEEIDVALNAAVNAGYNYVDSFYGYSNESAIGHSLKKMFDVDKINRKDIFVSTKDCMSFTARFDKYVSTQLPPIGNRAEDVELFLKRSLKALKLDYVDLYALSTPFGFIRRGESLAPTNENGDILLDPNTDILRTWKAMEAQVVAGRTKRIGLVNFDIEQIQRILDNCSIRPANIQLELHVCRQLKDLVSFCKKSGISVTAIVPFEAPPLPTYLEYGHQNPKKKPISSTTNDILHLSINEIGKKYNKKPSQVLVRYLVEYGVGVIVKTINPTVINDSFDVFDFELTKEEHLRISALDRGNYSKILES